MHTISTAGSCFLKKTDLRKVITQLGITRCLLWRPPCDEQHMVWFPTMERENERHIFYFVNGNSERIRHCKMPSFINLKVLYAMLLWQDSQRIFLRTILNCLRPVVNFYNDNLVTFDCFISEDDIFRNTIFELISNV